MSQTKTEQDFQALPLYSQSVRTNAAWVAVTLTKQDDLGLSQVLIIQPRQQVK